MVFYLPIRTDTGEASREFPDRLSARAIAIEGD